MSIYIYNIYVHMYIYNIYVIMNTMSPMGYHHNGFVATHALRHMMYMSPMSCHKATLLIIRNVYCFHDYIMIIYIMII